MCVYPAAAIPDDISIDQFTATPAFQIVYPGCFLEAELISEYIISRFSSIEDKRGD
jgi:hypothetical protein